MESILSMGIIIAIALAFGGLYELILWLLTKNKKSKKTKLISIAVKSNKNKKSA